SIQGARQRSVKQLERKARFVLVPEKYTIDPEVLGAGIGIEIFPLGMLGILGRLHRAWSDVAKTAGHADAIGPDQILVVVVARVRVVALRIPFFRRGFVEVRVGKKPQPDDAAGITVKRPDGNLLAARADLHSGIFLLVLDRLGRAILAAGIEPEAEAVGGRAGGFLEARLVHQAEITPAVVAAKMLDARVRG